MNTTGNHLTILEALDCEYLLTPWEWKFINDLAGRDKEWRVSAKQEEILAQIQKKLDRG